MTESMAEPPPLLKRTLKTPPAAARTPASSSHSAPCRGAGRRGGTRAAVSKLAHGSVVVVGGHASGGSRACLAADSAGSSGPAAPQRHFSCMKQYWSDKDIKRHHKKSDTNKEEGTWMGCSRSARWSASWVRVAFSITSLRPLHTPCRQPTQGVDAVSLGGRSRQRVWMRSASGGEADRGFGCGQRRPPGDAAGRRGRRLRRRAGAVRAVQEPGSAGRAQPAVFGLLC